MAVADCNAPVVNRRVRARGRSLTWITLAIKEKSAIIITKKPLLFIQNIFVILVGQKGAFNSL